MVRIVKTEFYKLKRYHILWAGVALMLLSVLLTLFTSMANDGSVWDFAYLTEQVIKNNMSMIFPMCISLIAGYMISREQTDDTLKNILTVPISFKKLLTGKLIVCGVLSIIFGLICSLFTIIAEMIVGFPGFEISLALKAALQITAVNFFLYLAVLPIIALTCRRTGIRNNWQDIYPLKEGYVGTSKDSKITSKQYDPAELARDESGNLKVF